MSRSTLPEGRPLVGYYSQEQQLFMVSNGSPQMAKNTPLPNSQHSSAISTDVKIPRFRHPRYLSLEFAYLAFIPRHNPFHHPLFRTLDRPRHKIPIMFQPDQGYRLHPDVAEEWLNLEHSLRAVGTAMIRIAPRRHLWRLINPWFFPGRFKFMHVFPTERAARFAAQYSAENFLPLLGYVAMGFWYMSMWEVEAEEAHQPRPDWRLTVSDKTKVHPAFLDYVEQSLIGDGWRVERVGALHHIQNLPEWTPIEREKRAEIEWMLNTVVAAKAAIPLYFYWGTFPEEVSRFDVPEPFHVFIPDTTDLARLASRRGEIKFIEYYVEQNFRKDSGQDSFWLPVPESTPAAAVPPSPASDPSSPPVPFPSRPPYSAQKKGETIQAFFDRRRRRNLVVIAKEDAVERQRRLQLTENAKKGIVGKKGHVFVWKKTDGHYIREPALRCDFDDLWAEYPASQRRFDSIHKEWDLCEIFQDGDPIFGEAFEGREDDEDYDEDMDHNMNPPTSSQNTAPAYRPPEEDAQPLQEDGLDGYVPTDAEFGPAVTEFEIEDRDTAIASRKCLDIVYVRFGLTQRTTDPVYETIASQLIDTLNLRFGFLMPRSAAEFSEQAAERVAVKDMGNIVGVQEIEKELSPHRGLANMLGIFFAQCTHARSVQDVDRSLLGPDPHHPHFEIVCESLKSMRDPAESTRYYVLHRRCGTPIGSDVLLFPRAADILEVLRQGWGPELRDVVSHLVARGIPFWHACVSAEIMSESAAVAKTGFRPKGFKADVTLGLGFRPKDCKVDVNDYNAYTTRRDLKLLHTPRGRVALQYGGVMARLARSEVSDEDAFRQLDADVYDVGDCLWDGASRYSYWHHKLSAHEIDLLCGVYQVATGTVDQITTVSWWPKPSAWARGNIDSWWTPQCEDFFRKRTEQLTRPEEPVYIVNNQSKWRNGLRYRPPVQKCWDGYERVAQSIAGRLSVPLKVAPLVFSKPDLLSSVQG